MTFTITPETIHIALAVIATAFVKDMWTIYSSHVKRAREWQ